MYIRIENEGFGFVTPDIHQILETDIPISDEAYNKFLELQSVGKFFKIKNPSGATFEEIFEEYTPEQIPQEPGPIEKLQAENAELKKQIEATQQGMAEIMNLIAMQGMAP